MNKIQDIAPLLADYLMYKDCTSEELKTNQELITSNTNRLGLYSKYLGKLHDSWFIKTNISDSKFSITLNDFTTHVFSDAIIKKNKIKIDHSRLTFPIQIDFEVLKLSYYSMDSDGNIRLIKETDVNEYLYEQIISIDDEKIEIGLVAWKNGVKNKRGKEILILIDIKSIILSEFQDNAWKEIFGNKYDHYYNYFKAQLNDGRYLSSYGICADLISEYDKLYN
ncbi:hypothetical protein HOO68_02005 [Candidatus Gracilibacteria bacterium]|nr:hypothetical protein [Candidatus Gracilibacteria bacterium]